MTLPGEDFPAARTLAVNCSTVMKALPVRERLRRVREAGGSAVEFWWPFTTARPSASAVDEFVAAIENARLELVGLNLFAGDMPGGERGVLSLPGREDELRASAQIALEIARRLGTDRFNVLYGNRLPHRGAEEQDAHADDLLRELAVMFADTGTLMIEPVSGAADYPILTAADAAQVVRRVTSQGGSPNVGILLDLYHLAVNRDDVDAAIAAHGSTAAHVQIADAPGRGAPGTAELPLGAWIRRLRTIGYAGWVALEYVDPDGDSLDNLNTLAEKELA